MRHIDYEQKDRILEFIDSFILDNGSSPTIAEISEGLHIAYSTCGRYIAAMKKRGELEYSGHRQIKSQISEKLSMGLTRVPLVGEVSCGLPTFAEENIEEYVTLPTSLFGQGEFFLLRAKGESMIGVGVNPGDLVLIKKQDYASRGEIALCLYEDDATLKRYFPEPEKRRVRLHPENPYMEDIYLDSCQIQGVAVNVIKNLI